jgi:ketosteroid isomerase-like protein
MTITTREAFERGTETFNAHDIEGFADVLADDVVWHIIDDLAVEEGTFTGTHDGTLYAPTGDIPPTGRPVEVDYIQVLRFRNGKHVHLMFDRLLILERLGLIAAPNASG